MSKPAIDQYQGSPTLCLNPEARYKFSFGVAKAKMILDHLEAIKAFVASDGNSCVPDDSPVQQTVPVSTLAEVVKLAGEQIGQRDAALKATRQEKEVGPNLDELRRGVF